ncbi:IS66-like element ISH10 family transposase [soil metagenome]
MLDLYHATRDELIAMVLRERDMVADRDRRITTLESAWAQQQATIAQLKAQVGALAAAAAAADDPGQGTPKGMPGLKPTQPPERERRPRKQRAKGFARRRMQATARQIHALASCPDCGAPLAGGTVKRTREVIDLPRPAVVVTEHVYVERCCPDCGRRCTPPPELGGVVMGQSRLGNRLVSLLAVLREEARLPVGTIRRLLQTLTGLQLSDGGIVGAVQRVATRAEPVVTDLLASIRASPVVHADETGWREDGRNGYVWTFNTPDTRVFLHGSRARPMLTRGLGEAFGGVLVSDFYTVYTGYAGVHQYCWAHLLRDVHDLTVQHPEDATVQGWAVAVQAVFARAMAATGPPAVRRHAQHLARTELKTLCQPWLEPRVPQTTLCQRMLKYLPELFVFVTNPDVPATNNAAERSLRALVISRKISGGTRSAAGTQTKMTLASLFGTWRVQGRNPYDACHELLATP